MLKSTVSKIVSGKPDRGVNKYMLEEVYFSDSCFNAGQNNPQRARFENGRYYFDFPDMWYNTLSNNKAVALRKIDLHAPSMNISADFNIGRINVSTGAMEYRTFHVSISIPPNQSTYSVMTQIAREVNKGLSPGSATKWDEEPYNTVILEAIYYYKDNSASFALDRSYLYGQNPDDYHYSLSITNFNNDFWTLFNLGHLEQAELPFVPPTVNSDGTTEYTFNNVWNREFCFVHASFVNGTSFNYLGRSGEFYPKPSKMYRFGGSSQQFYFELSYDGRTPITYVLGNFCIDLAFIYHDKDYQAE